MGPLSTLGQDKTNALQTAREEVGSMEMHHSVLSVAFPFVSVSEDSVGGAEQVVSRLDLAVTASGGQSIVIACEGSSVSGTLMAVPAVEGEVTPEKQKETWKSCNARIAEALNHYPVDLIHFHGIDFFHYMPATRIPKLVTLHLPPSWYPPDVFTWPDEANVFLQCVSESQHSQCPSSKCLLPPIANGVFVPPQPPCGSKSDFVFSLGRICPEKGFHLALDAAKQAGTSMILAGAAFGYEAHQRYLTEEILPRLDGQRQFIGPVGKNRKRRLLSQARCLLVPSLVPETSSLVAMEALAFGTPVIAFRSGALSEIIENGCNGFLVKDADEMADAIRVADSISAEKCWASARDRYNSEQMIARYLERYQWIAATSRSVRKWPC